MWQLWLRLSWHDIGLWVVCCVIMAIVVEAIAEIITSSALFAPVRVFLSTKALPVNPADARWYWAMLDRLLACGYCCSVWLAFAASWCVPGDRLGINIVITTFVIHRLANLYHSLFELLRRGRVRTYDISLTIKCKSGDESGDDDASS